LTLTNRGTYVLGHGTPKERKKERIGVECVLWPHYQLERCAYRAPILKEGTREALNVFWSTSFHMMITLYTSGQKIGGIIGPLHEANNFWSIVLL
jgi:hypothetical protein